MSDHSEWLSLIDVSGPFLAEPVLKDAFPQGLQGLDPTKTRTVRQAYDEWREALDLDDPAFQKIHRAWIDLILKQVLEFDENGNGDLLKSASNLPDTVRCELPEHDITLGPDYALTDGQASTRPLILITIYGPEISLTESLKGDGWAANPAERMVELCRATDVRLGLVTNGENWMLVDAPVGAVTTFASWYARLWGQEPVTLQAFVNLLGIRRFFVDVSEQLPALLDNSLKFQDEVTDTLGEQVSRAVEALIQALDRADVDRNRELLDGVTPAEMYEAGLTVMMRIVFLLSAEERGLLLLGDERYEANYAVSTLRMQLRGESEEILERRWDAWSRLLSIFRAVFGGVDHEAMRLPAMGGSLFDPDRFPFLEGRKKGSSWKIDTAIPLPIDNRTVLYLLDAVQLFQGRTLSYLGLDIEQMGYVYEGLLDRTVVRTKEVMLDLDATKAARNHWVSMSELDEAAAKGRHAVEGLLKDRTGSSANRIKNHLDKTVDEGSADKLLTACHADQSLRDRLRPYFHLLRTDRWGYPLIYPKDTFMVRTGRDRRQTGAHYTPKSLTETIVQETLEPLVYIGPSEGKPREGWTLKFPDQILDLKICDPAMGSGAFLVQVCRWLSERLVEAWAKSEREGKGITSEGEVVDDIGACEPLRNIGEERLITARRLIAERCLYGVDMNPLAVELAKLSIWLVTLAKGRPFGFLDHNLRCGDSLLGIHNLEMLNYLDMRPTKVASKKLFASKIEQAVKKAIALRSDLRARPIHDIRDVEVMVSLDRQARQELELPELIADALVGEYLAVGGKSGDTTSLSIEAGAVMEGTDGAVEALKLRALKGLRADLPDGKLVRRPFHWALEFPEIFSRENAGFDAFVGNPPFLGNSSWKSNLGASYLVNIESILGSKAGKIDLSIVFYRRALSLLRSNGVFGLIAANNIAEGGALKVGLNVLVASGEIIRSRRDFVWPGGAAVITAFVVFFKGTYAGIKKANDEPCAKINSHLQAESEKSKWSPVSLKKKLFAFKGIDNSRGLAFVLEESNSWKPLLENERDSLLRPYITGNDITTHCLRRIDRLALDLGDRSLESIKASHPVAYQFLEEVVRQTRSKTELSSYSGLFERWWQFWNHRAKQFAILRKQKETIAFSRVTKHPICLLVPSEYLYTEGVILIGFGAAENLAICQTPVFTEWLVATQGAKFGVGGSLRLSLNEGINTFPLPQENVSQAGISASRELDFLIKQWCEKASCGVTEYGNALGDLEQSDASIQQCRDAVRFVTAEVAKAYQFDPMDIEFGFYEARHIIHKKEVAFTVSPRASRLLIDGLLERNKVAAATPNASPRSIQCASERQNVNFGESGLFGKAGAVEAEDSHDQE